MSKRIASLLASGTEILYGLGLGERVVAVSHECDFPPEVLGKPRVTFAQVNAAAASADIDREVKARLAAGEPLYGVNVDRLAELRPDLIITQSQCDVCAVSDKDLARAAAGSPALATVPVVSLNPTTLPAVFADIARVAEAAGDERHGERYLSALRRRVQRVQDQVASVPPADRPRVACIEWIAPLMIAGNWMPELIELAGGDNRLAHTGKRTTYADWNAVRDYDPQVIIVAPCGFDLQRTRQETEALPRLPGWGDLAAVRNSRIYAADGNAYFNRSGPRLIDTLEILAATFHPSRFDTSCMKGAVERLA